MLQNCMYFGSYFIVFLQREKRHTTVLSGLLLLIQFVGDVLIDRDIANFEIRSLLPWQFPETVAEKVVDKLTSGTSGVVYAPEMAEYIAMIRAMPMWWQIFIRNGAGKTLTRLGRSGS